MQAIIGFLRRNSGQFQLLLDSGFTSNHVTEFAEALNYSNLPSVDLFLERRQAFLEVGKAAIALVLIPSETLAVFDRANGLYCWYQYLWERLDAPLDQFSENKLSVVTFNYDRSLEHSLFLSLKHTYGLSDEQAAEHLQTVPIIHVYGELNELPYLQPSGRPYDPQISPEIIRKCASAMTILHEGQEDSPQFSRARKLLMEASTICFLGFGYHPTNIWRLGLKTMAAMRSYPKVWGTTLGLTRAECVEIQKLLPWPMHGEFGVSTDRKIVDYLRENSILG